MIIRWKSFTYDVTVKPYLDEQPSDIRRLIGLGINSIDGTTQGFQRGRFPLSSRDYTV